MNKIKRSDTQEVLVCTKISTTRPHFLLSVPTCQVFVYLQCGTVTHDDSSYHIIMTMVL